MRQQKENAKQCAIICVDEYLNFADAHWNEVNWSGSQDLSYKFWKEVKSELEQNH